MVCFAAVPFTCQTFFSHVCSDYITYLRFLDNDFYTMCLSVCVDHDRHSEKQESSQSLASDGAVKRPKIHSPDSQ